MAIPINKLGDPVLRCAAKPISAGADDLSQIIKDMSETLKAANGLGLAAPQVGILKRLFIYDLGDGVKCFVNPEIVWTSEETSEDTEGCLSIPGREVTVRRPVAVKVAGCDEMGTPIEIEAEELMARMFQHEIDHLNGILIIDRASEAERRQVIADFIKEDRT
jgi:peptide deformylase